MSFSFCFTNVAVISSLSLLVSFGLTTGGPVIMIFGWILVSILTMIVGASMGEICSTYPVAGSVYYWSGVLAPKEWSAFSSYICGWFNFLGNIANNSSFAYGLSEVLSGVFSIMGYGNLTIY